MPMPRSMLLEEFLPLVGREFRVDCSPAEVPVVLEEAYPLRDSGLADRPPFMLIFRSSPGALLLTGGYAMQCGGWGPELIHISQIMAPAKTEPGHYYQAVFN